MSFDCRIDKELGGVVVRATNVVGLDDVRAGVDEIVALSGFKPGMHQLFDLTDGGLDLDQAESRVLAQFFQSAEVRAKLGSGYRLAVVASRPVDFGTARVYQVHEESDSIAILVFYEMERALAWGSSYDMV